MVKRICQFCRRSFDARPQDVARGFSFYCNRQCYYDHVKSGERRRQSPPRATNASCSYCSKSFYRAKSKLKTKHGFVFCNRICKENAQRLGGLKEIQPPHFGTGLRHYRDIAFDQYPKVCSRCGFNKDTRAIIVHHIDRNRSNNCISNLEVLCCNCHMIDHYADWYPEANTKYLEAF